MLYLPAEFPLEPDLCYLNHAAIGPWPRRTAQCVANFAQQVMMRAGSDYPEWLATEARLRGRIATLINAPSPDDIALLKNTSEGLSIISQGLDWQPGDQVIGIRDDFCSNTMPWSMLGSRGVTYQGVDIGGLDDPEQALIDALNPSTRLLAISTVHFATGYRFDLERLAAACREHQVLLSIDAIQSLGARAMDVQAIDADFVTCGGHKWLMAPEGIGFMYCRAGLRDAIRLHQFGWAMRESPYAFESETWEPASSARRFEAGTPNMLGIHALDASLSLFEEVGLETVERQLAEKLDRLTTGLSQLPGVRIVTPPAEEKRAGILTFRHERISGDQLHAELMQRQVVCSPRAGGVRFSPHFYTLDAVLDRAIGTVADVIGHN
jgi:selenocysteine lyase/cysteine desulfurase